MNGSVNLVLYQISIRAIPALIAITFHEASHGYVAHLLGDDTAWRLGRVSFNPLVHIDPFGTVLLPLILLLLRSPFLFGYAKPVPVNFRALRYPRAGTILVAAAGPGMNLLLAIIAALGFHIVAYIPAPGAQCCPLLGLSGRADRRQPRQLSGVKRTSQFDCAAAANDP